MFRSMWIAAIATVVLAACSGEVPRRFTAADENFGFVLPERWRLPGSPDKDRTQDLLGAKHGNVLVCAGAGCDSPMLLIVGSVTLPPSVDVMSMADLERVIPAETLGPNMQDLLPDEAERLSSTTASAVFGRLPAQRLDLSYRTAKGSYGSVTKAVCRRNACFLLTISAALESAGQIEAAFRDIEASTWVEEGVS